LRVDDNVDSCDLIELLLHRSISDLRLDTASDGLQAIKLLEENEYDLYILDYWLPDIDGVELCRRIREKDPSTPIIFYTAAALPAEKKRALAAGATEYLVKPNDFDRVAARVRIQLALRDRKAQVSA
jgi:DNA-binding response OmpR family regulator